MAKKKRWSFKPALAKSQAPVPAPGELRGMGGSALPHIPAHPQHRGSPVRVGEFTIYAGGTRDLRAGDLTGYDLVIPLTGGSLPLARRERTVVWSYELQDYGGVPEDWANFLQDVIAELHKGSKIIAFCMGSHGRTGTFLASLVSLLESEAETPDPITAVRERHCYKAVETLAQAEAVFALRGASLPEKYSAEFKPRMPIATSGVGAGFTYSSHRPGGWWNGNE